MQVWLAVEDTFTTTMGNTYRLFASEEAAKAAWPSASWLPEKLQKRGWAGVIGCRHVVWIEPYEVQE